MRLPDITNHAELRLRIMQLNAEQYSQEEMIRTNLKEIFFSINPVSIIKNSLHELVVDKEVQTDFAKLSLNLVSDFIIGKISGRSIKSNIMSVILEKVSGMLIKGNSEKIMSGINKLFSKQV